MDLDLETLLGGDSSATGGSLLDPSALLAPLMPFVILLTVASIVIGILYILNMITTYRSHKATIEMRDIMREMNERDKARSPDTGTKPPVTDYAAAESASSGEPEKS